MSTLNESLALQKAITKFSYYESYRSISLTVYSLTHYMPTLKKSTQSDNPNTLF